MKKIVLFSVQNFDREVPDKLLIKSIVDMDTLIKAINEEVGSEVVTMETSDTIIQVYSVDDFIIACNDGVIDIDEYWIGSVNFKTSEDVVFTTKDMRESFVAGCSFGETFLIIDMSLTEEGEEEPEEEPDFGEWMKEKYGIEL